MVLFRHRLFSPCYFSVATPKEAVMFLFENEIINYLIISALVLLPLGGYYAGKVTEQKKKKN
ncbi:Hypothetical protein Nlim_1723 [Candidatus Nitrosarchaeum limnium SFB1]|jgi:hypothetical protein|uniref:Uncharacterized protein n=1 Tax=Candidatus Nitrosarchaeum limnium SFB1 TaxID=886738 RepID=F3KMH3_9ARCH|nr:Hypothetical protein Nlim_1723 [Candidatus Nitrosarchaeum limnium SFB1]